MKFKHVGEVPEDTVIVPCYGGTSHEVGGIVDIPDEFVYKAQANPCYEEYWPKVEVVEVVKPKPKRRAKKAD